MKIKFNKIALILAIILLVTNISGCGNNQNETYDNYSYGLTETGLYENLSKHPCSVENFINMTISCEDILQWNFEYMAESDSSLKSVDNYVYLYGEEFLATLGIASKEFAEVGDIVSASLEFYIDGKLLEDYVTTGSYEIGSENDSIVGSFIGKKANDTYEVEFTFPADSEDYPSQTATVKVMINTVLYSDPITNGVVEKNLDVIGKYLDGVTDVTSFLEALKPKIATATLTLYIEDCLQSYSEIKAPDEYVEYELYRLKARLQQIGYTYKEYLKATSMTDSEVRSYCTEVATENYICMTLFDLLGCEITEAEVAEYYGENSAYLAEVQGEPYMRLNMLRDVVIQEIANMATLTYNGVVIED